MRNNAVCRVKNRAGGAVVLFKFDLDQFGEVFFKQKQILVVCPPPGINWLIIVPDYANVAFASFGVCQKPKEPVLNQACVLEFVHQNIAAALAVLFQNFGVFFKNVYWQSEEIVKVQSVVDFQAVLVFIVRFLPNIVGNVCACFRCAAPPIPAYLDVWKKALHFF